MQPFRYGAPALRVGNGVPAWPDPPFPDRNRPGGCARMVMPIDLLPSAPANWLGRTVPTGGRCRPAMTGVPATDALVP